jgi:hypothetical protein
MGVRSQEGSGADMSYNGPEVPLYRPTSRWAVPYEEWRDDAACDGLPTELFELGDVDLITGEDQHELIAQGLRICNDCPVKKSCLVNSNEQDRYWTTRGGQPPEGLFPDSVRPEPGSSPASQKGGWRPRPLKKKCKRDHEDWAFRADGKRYCATCKKAGDAGAWKRRKVKAGTMDS